MHPFEIPERAIGAFERTHRLIVTVHDLSGSLTPFLKPTRFHHCSPLCLAVKAQGRLEACKNFEIKRLRPELVNLTEGRIHVCHSNLVEWVVPVFEKEKPAWVLFAGPRFPGKTLISALREPLIPWPKSPWAKIGALPLPVEEEEAQHILEHLRQLAGRLHVWAERHHPGGTGASADVTLARSLTTRSLSIQRFIEENYEKPLTLSMVAKALSLSQSRASHVIRQSCSNSFRELLIQRRLQAAMELLRKSDMTILQIAMACGFEDVAHFHRLFRKRVGTTPAQYRVKGQS